MWYKFDKQSLTYKRITGKLLAIGIGAVLTLSLIASLITIYQAKDIRYISAETRAIVLSQEDEFSLQNLKAYLIQLNVKYPEIVLAQAQLETGNFTSQVFLENHNCFGMRMSSGRPTTAIGCVNTYAVYHCWKESVEDYAFYAASYLTNIKNEKDYLQYLKQNYAEDTLYVNKIKAQIEKNK